MTDFDDMEPWLSRKRNSTSPPPYGDTKPSLSYHSPNYYHQSNVVPNQQTHNYYPRQATQRNAYTRSTHTPNRLLQRPYKRHKTLAFQQSHQVHLQQVNSNKPKDNHEHQIQQPSQHPLLRRLTTQRLAHDLRNYQTHIQNLSMAVEDENKGDRNAGRVLGELDETETLRLRESGNISEADRGLLTIAAPTPRLAPGFGRSRHDNEAKKEQRGHSRTS